MRHTFTAEQWLPYPVQTVFAFFANPDNLPRLMPAWQRARIDSAKFAPPPPHPPGSTPSRPGMISAGVGTTMTISFRPVPFSPIRVKWEAAITDFTWNNHFCDKQEDGPFAFWRHCHRVEAQVNAATGRDGTRLQDSVEYEMPLGPLGEVARELFVERQLKTTFAYRQKRTLELLRTAAES